MKSMKAVFAAFLMVLMLAGVSFASLERTATVLTPGAYGQADIAQHNDD